MNYLRMLLLALLCATFWCSDISTVPVTSAEESEKTQQPQDFVGASGSAPVTMHEPPMGESSDSCEIESCGMGTKEISKMTCPADKMPKCSCDCVRNFGPRCIEYKANCRCE